MTDKPRHPTPTEQAAMDARQEPDASGREYVHLYSPTDPVASKQQPAQRHELIEEWEMRGQEWIEADDMAQIVEHVGYLIRALDAQAAEIAGLEYANKGAVEAEQIAERLAKQNAALREALSWYADPANWDSKIGKPSPAQLDGGSKARAKLEASDEQ